MSPGPAAGTGAPERRAWNRLTRSYHRLVERLASLPTTFLHGEFYPSNILVGDSGSDPARVCPVDWETAALGPALLDLAAYVSGSWTEAERASLIAAYRDALPGPEVATAGTSSERDFLETLDGCRLHVAVRWLGWSAGWSPPAAHVHDWFAEALSLGERLKLC
jgi:aminoglycoside phosphotransferase (APT) family kinase protein